MNAKKMFFLTIFGLLLSTGCIGPYGPYYGSKAQYDKGHWRGWTDNRGVNERDQQMLAVGKLQAQPVMVGTMTSTGVVANVVAPAPGVTAPAGYKGIVANLSRRHYNFIIRGPENRAFYLGPGQKAPESACYLLPGRYIATIDYDGYQVGKPHIFDVGPGLDYFQGEPCHWYLVAGDRW